MRVAVVALLGLLALVGCRHGFDELRADGWGPDVVLANHDEDGDGTDDALDLCPHIPDDGANSDGDGVGDACDPLPSTPTESIAYFDPFTAPRSEWMLLTSIVPNYDGEHVFADTRTGVLRLGLPVVPAIDVFELGGDLGARGTTQEQIAIAAREVGGAHYVCEIYASGTARLKLTYTLDQVSYPSIDQVIITGPIENAPFMLRMRTTAPDLASCDSSWPGAQTIGGMRPAGIAPTIVAIYTLGLDVRWDYFIQIRTTP